MHRFHGRVDVIDMFSEQINDFRRGIFISIPGIGDNGA